ncbi:hypothetical protein VNO77_27920 [Canavalia gladiata]|uniref:Uncharacterized protein n=1 Tax=Canavalia gladiata TaxID=3824 RepID=A0AAN9KV13_CANGL
MTTARTIIYGVIPPPLTLETLSTIMGNNFFPNLALATLLGVLPPSSVRLLPCNFHAVTQRNILRKILQV